MSKTWNRKSNRFPKWSPVHIIEFFVTNQEIQTWKTAGNIWNFLPVCRRQVKIIEQITRAGCSVQRDQQNVLLSGLRPDTSLPLIRRPIALLIRASQFKLKRDRNWESLEEMITDSNKSMEDIKVRCLGVTNNTLREQKNIFSSSFTISSGFSKASPELRVHLEGGTPRTGRKLGSSRNVNGKKNSTASTQTRLQCNSETVCNPRRSALCLLQLLKHFLTVPYFNRFTMVSLSEHSSERSAFKYRKRSA